MGREPRVVALFQPWANFRSAFSAFESRQFVKLNLQQPTGLGIKAAAPFVSFCNSESPVFEQESHEAALTWMSSVWTTSMAY